MDEQKRPQWDEILSGFKIIEKIDKNTDIIYFYVKSPNVLMIDHRSFCQIRILRHDFPEKGQITILLKSIDHQNCPPEKSKFIRAETIISGYIITQIGNDCNFKLLSQVDIKGQIPVMVVNTFSQKAPQEWIEKLIKVIKQK